MRQVFYFFNYLYKHHFWLYKPIYFAYKRITDRTKIGLMQQLIPSGAVVLDIGANIGYYSLEFSRIVGYDGLVYAFEPDQRNYSLLKKKLAPSAPNVKAFQVAVGNHQGIIKLYHSEGLNVDHQTYDSGEGRSWHEIPVVKLDDFLPDDLVLHFVKIDIQGYDYYAIKGMTQSLERSKSVIILGELWPYGLKKAGVSVWAYLSLLETLGLTIFFFLPLTHDKLTEMEGQLEEYTDYLALRTAHFDQAWLDQHTLNMYSW